MLDFRYETFLALNKIGNYTKTAEFLHITQPAVSQHIKFLEKYYGGKLFYYKDKTLLLTQRGKKLYDFVLTMSVDSKHLKNMLCNENISITQLNFGATLSIGEFVCPEIISQLIKKYPDTHINMPVDNTQVLLRKLQDGEINFAFVEGFFDKSEYGYELFSVENFIAVCGEKHKLCNKAVTLEDILSERIIIREKGSGTRDVFEQILYKNNLSVNSFKKVCEIGNMSTIKHLVSSNIGITFLYKIAVKKELETGILKEINVQNLPVSHEFNFVYLKNSLHKNEYISWFNYFKNIFGD